MEPAEFCGLNKDATICSMASWLRKVDEILLDWTDFFIPVKTKGYLVERSSINEWCLNRIPSRKLNWGFIA